MVLPSLNIIVSSSTFCLDVHSFIRIVNNNNINNTIETRSEFRCKLHILFRCLTNYFIRGYFTTHYKATTERLREISTDSLPAWPVYLSIYLSVLGCSVGPPSNQPTIHHERIMLQLHYIYKYLQCHCTKIVQ